MRPEIQKRLTSAAGKGVDLEKLNITDDEIKEIIAEIRKTKPDMLFLSLRNNEIKNQGAIILSQELSAFKKLRSLDLQFNQIDEKGCEAVLLLRNTHPGIILALHGNLVTDTAEMAKKEEKNSPSSI